MGAKLLGSLPLERAKLRSGTHLLTVRSPKLGYAMTHRVTVRAGEHQRLRLTPRKGTIRILVNPWARVTLDGRLLGITPLQPVQVYEGPHRLVFENKKLSVTQRRTVKVEPGKAVVVRLVLK
jgi:serine/threonine-protein kinase